MGMLGGGRGRLPPSLDADSAPSLHALEQSVELATQFLLLIKNAQKDPRAEESVKLKHCRLADYIKRITT